MNAELALGHLAYSIHDHRHALTHYEAALAAVTSDDTSPTTAAALAGRASVLRNLNRIAEAEQDARRASTCLDTAATWLERCWR